MVDFMSFVIDILKVRFDVVGHDVSLFDITIFTALAFWVLYFIFKLLE